jgi:glycosyltransferase involved in cell wall biosynthesis
MKQHTNNIKQQTLRIGFDAKRAFNNGTGLGNYSRFIINGLMRLFPQYEYFLFTPSIKPEFANFYPEGANINLVTPESFIGQKFSALWRTYAIADMCETLQLDIFHGLSNELPVGIERFSGKKVVTIHDLIFLRYPAYYNNIDRFIYTKKFKRACERADLIIAASKQTQQDIVSYFETNPDKIAIGYQNCDERFASSISAEQKLTLQLQYGLPERFVLCVGTIEQRKNQLTVLKAFHQLKHSDLHLVFIGRQTNYADQLHAYILQNGLSNRVQFLQGILGDHLPGIYQMATVFVYASEFEGFGIPILEGMRSGIPVITADASSLPEVGGPVISYFRPDDAHRLATLIEEAIHNPFNPTSYDNQLRLFDTPNLINQLVNLYQS